MHDSQQEALRARIVSSIAATLIALACGTNYVYSAWAPQFAERLHLSSTESNIIGLAGNLGMATMGVPVGVFVDHRGPRPAVLGGAILLAVGYFPFHQAYDQGSGSIPLLCIFSYLTGMGGCMGLAAAVKTSALNWPQHRGTATAFPLAAFGLSAFFFSLLGSLIAPGNPSVFLMLLAWGTSCITLGSYFFLRVYQQPDYEVIPEVELTELHGGANSHRVPHSSEPDIRGFELLRTLSFWQLFSIMGIFAGIGIMTINNIGSNAKALWMYRDSSVTEKFLVKRQQFHVSILSLCSFLGRLSSGVGSDFLVKGLNASRLWCLVLSGLVFLLAQILALNIENPHLLIFVSGFSGLGYGFLFGVYPSIVAEMFGIRGLSQNWGFITLSPVLLSNVFNIFYGSVFDKHSKVQENGHRTCLDGLACYRTSYLATLAACTVGLGITLWIIKHERQERILEAGKGEEED